MNNNCVKAKAHNKQTILSERTYYVWVLLPYSEKILLEFSENDENPIYPIKCWKTKKKKKNKTDVDTFRDQVLSLIDSSNLKWKIPKKFQYFPKKKTQFGWL